MAALKHLVDGNKRFRNDELTHTGQDPLEAHQLSMGQHPWAIILGCADSREVPELFFDQPLGALFTHRVAGNVVDDHMLGSIEYALTEFKAPLIIVAGHERCGAVTATVEVLEKNTTPAGHISSLVDAIRPSVTASSRDGMSQNDKITAAVAANAAASAQQLTANSPIINKAVTDGTTRILAAIYNLDDLTVTFTDPTTHQPITA